MNILLVNLGRHTAYYDQLVNCDLSIENLYMAENDENAATCVLNTVGENIKISKALSESFIDDLLRICLLS